MNALYSGSQAPSSGFVHQLAEEFTQLLNDWHSLPETWDNALDSQIHEWYVNPPKLFPKKPYFSPSAANGCPRELYEKAKGAKRDKGGQPPYQKRWTSIGTLIGDMIQRDLLFIEKHGEKALGYTPRFRFERNASGQPMFEDFAKASVPIKTEDTFFHLYGAPDGIMQYVTDDGEVIRIGLEIKSKQTSAARTSLYSLREADEKHVAQVTAYAVMYDLDYYLILYVNTAKKAWVLSDKDFAETPDIRVFGVECTQERKERLIGQLAEIQKAVDNGTPPKLDIGKWTFNGFKTACAKSLSDEEMAEISEQVRKIERSGVRDFMKRQYREALDDLLAKREALQ